MYKHITYFHTDTGKTKHECSLHEFGLCWLRSLIFMGYKGLFDEGLTFILISDSYVEVSTQSFDKFSRKTEKQQSEECFK